MIEAPDREGLAGERDLGFVAKVWSCVSQRRPRATMSRPLRLYSVLVLGLLSLCSFSGAKRDRSCAAACGSH